jgi:fatty acid desaturase
MADALHRMPVHVRSARRSKLSPMSEYAREIRSRLPPEIFKRQPIRLLWLPVHLVIITTLALFIVRASMPLPLAILAALVAGHSWGCLGLLAHETLHQAVVKNRLVQRLVGAVGFLPFVLSPTLWVAWHNQAHHGYTGDFFMDPDHFGTFHLWQESRYLQLLESLTPGSGYLRSTAFLCTFFSVNSVLMLVFGSEQKGFYSRISRGVVHLETMGMASVWFGVLFLVGCRNFIFVWLLPTLVANTLVMSYIATNHLLNPLTSTNDPLANTLSVTAPRWLEMLHLQFGYHVEHHIFPTMSARYARTVRDVLASMYGSRYLSMPHARALRLLYSRPKLHSRLDVLINPRSGAMYRTLTPGDLSMRELQPTQGPEMRRS